MATSATTAAATNTAPGEATAMIKPAARGPSRPPHASKIVLTAFAEVSSSGVSANSGMSDDWIGRGSVTRVAASDRARRRRRAAARR